MARVGGGWSHVSHGEYTPYGFHTTGTTQQVAHCTFRAADIDLLSMLLSLPGQGPSSCLKHQSLNSASLSNVSQFRRCCMSINVRDGTRRKTGVAQCKTHSPTGAVTRLGRCSEMVSIRRRSVSGQFSIYVRFSCKSVIESLKYCQKVTFSLTASSEPKGILQVP